MIEEFTNKRGAFIRHKNGALEMHDFDIRDLYNDLAELIVEWDKSNLVGNKNLSAFSDFKKNVVIRIGDDEYSMSTDKAFKLWKDLDEAIKESI